MRFPEIPESARKWETRTSTMVTASFAEEKKWQSCPSLHATEFWTWSRSWSISVRVPPQGSQQSLKYLWNQLKSKKSSLKTQVQIDFNSQVPTVKLYPEQLHQRPSIDTRRRRKNATQQVSKARETSPNNRPMKPIKSEDVGSLDVSFALGNVTF